MNIKKIVIAFGLISTATFAQDAQKGEALYKTCVECHGADGMGIEAQEAPRIAGQFDWYILDQLKKIKSRERKAEKMYPKIKNLSETDFVDLAAYVSKMGKK